MTLTFFILLAIALSPMFVVAYLVMRPPPMGYEDEDGFHFGG